MIKVLCKLKGVRLGLYCLFVGFQDPEYGDLWDGDIEVDDSGDEVSIDTLLVTSCYQERRSLAAIFEALLPKDCSRFLNPYCVIFRII